jgi:tetratricopeptide (TPR) repeat protein
MSTAGVRPRYARRALQGGLILAGALLALGLGWYGWRWYTAPQPPEVAVAETDPALAEAVAQARDQVRRAPYSAAAWANLGKLLRASQFNAQAVTCFAQAERLEPGNPRWPYLRGEGLLPGDPDGALPHLRRAVELFDREGVDTVVPRLRLAEVLLVRGHLDEAEAQLRQAGEEDPDNAVVPFHLGLLAYTRGDWEASRRHLLRCQYSPFTRRKACARLAEVCQRLDRAREAGEFSRRAAALPDDVPLVDPFVAECYRLAVGRPARAEQVEHLEGQGLQLLAGGQAAEAQARFREAVRLLGALAEKHPDARTYVALGRNLSHLGDFPGAERALGQALRLAPDNVRAHYQLARVLEAQAEQRQRQGDRAGAQSLLRAAAGAARRALTHNPQHARSHLFLGLCLQRLGEKKEALAELQATVRCSPDLAEAHFHLGQALAEEGRAEEARGHLEQAARLAPPGDTRAKAALEALSRGTKRDG